MGCSKLGNASPTKEAIPPPKKNPVYCFRIEYGKQKAICSWKTEASTFTSFHYIYRNQGKSEIA